jgi:nonsense-mediated mRNA decay protein 3
MKAAFESKEMMQLCLKRLKGLHKVHLVDASFIWTEPHSKRIKLKLQIQKEIFKGAVIQQGFVVEFVIHWLQCEMCQRIATGQPQWDAVVQLRQKVEHRRTFLYLEQLILRNGMHKDATKILVQPDGLDFFFGHKSHGMRFLDFIGGLVPLIRKDSMQLVTQDDKSNTAEIHHTFSAEIAPICREDLICLPKKLCASMGGLGPVVLCHKVFSSIVLMDPSSLRVGEILGTFYWKMPFLSVASSKQQSEFYIIDIRIMPGHSNGKMQLADATVCLANEVGQGREWIIRTHLGNVLQPGDSAMGYLIPALNCNHDDFTEALLHNKTVPDVILVRKHYPSQKRRRRRRQWKINTLPKEGTDGPVRKGDKQAADEDLDEFLDDLERDVDYRAVVGLYKDDSHKLPDGTSTVADDDDNAVVGQDELLDEASEPEEEEAALPPADTSATNSMEKAPEK